MDLTQEQWEQQQVAATNAVILDVRSQEEFDQGHIPQAQLLDIRQPQAFMDGIAELDRNKTYFSIVVREPAVLRPVKLCNKTELPRYIIY